MDQADHIEADVPLTHEEAYSRLDGIIHISNSKKEAEEYVKKNGGVIFKEKDMEVYRVFPDKFNNYVGQVNLSMREE